MTTVATQSNLLTSDDIHRQITLL